MPSQRTHNRRGPRGGGHHCRLPGSSHPPVEVRAMSSLVVVKWQRVQSLAAGTREPWERVAKPRKTSPPSDDRGRRASAWPMHNRIWSFTPPTSSLLHSDPTTWCPNPRRTSSRVCSPLPRWGCTGFRGTKKSLALPRTLPRQLANLLGYQPHDVVCRSVPISPFTGNCRVVPLTRER